MKYDWLDQFSLEKKGVQKDYQVEWEATRYLIGGKMFLMVGGDKEGRPIITMKLEPEFGHMMRQEYEPDVVPGYYMNKEHWNSVYVAGRVPDEVLREMIGRSYALVLGSLSKKGQKEILEA